LIDGRAFTVKHEAIAIDSQGYRERVFECGEILIELSEQPEVIAKRT
jgi:hypothetical protein